MYSSVLDTRGHVSPLPAEERNSRQVSERTITVTYLKSKGPKTEP